MPDGGEELVPPRMITSVREVQPAPVRPTTLLGRIGDAVRWVFTNKASGIDGGSTLVDIASTQTGSRSDYFGPGEPMHPTAPRVVAGRQMDYPVAVNVRLQPRPEDEGISFYELRALAENYDFLRLLIETRKDQMEALTWKVSPIVDDPDDAKEMNIDDATQARIDKVKAILAHPDGEHSFGTWLRMLVEDLLVIDAPTLYCNTEDFDPMGFEIIDGATIKRLIDSSGRTPKAPEPAYQQIIHGLPAIDYDTTDIIYMPRNPRPSRIYGYSPVQQIIMTVNIALRRQISQLEYFASGNMPDTLIGTPETWSPAQIREYQQMWDSLHEGNLAERRKAKFIPGGARPTFTKDPILKNEFDEWLARVCCYALSIPPTAFVRQSNRSTAETAKAAATEEGLAPLMLWATQMINYIIQVCLGEDDLEFTWADEPDHDEDAQSKIMDRDLRNGSRTINEVRAARGDDPVADGDTPMIYTGQAPIPLAMAVKGPQPPVVAIPGAKGPNGSPQAQSSGASGAQETPVSQAPQGKEPAPSGKTRKTVPQIAVGDIVEVDSDTGTASNAPWRSVVIAVEGGGSEIRVAYDDGAGLYRFNYENLLNEPVANGPNDSAYWHFSKLSKAVPRPIYIYRRLLNGDELISWAKLHGFKSTYPADEMHVTIAYSNDPVDWRKITPDTEDLRIVGGTRSIQLFGDDTLVLTFESDELTKRWNAIRTLGASWAYDEYHPHVSISQQMIDGDPAAIMPYAGELLFGPEVFDMPKKGWAADLVEQVREVGKSASLPFLLPPHDHSAHSPSVGPVTKKRKALKGWHPLPAPSVSRPALLQLTQQMKQQVQVVLKHTAPGVAHEVLHILSTYASKRKAAYLVGDPTLLARYLVRKAEGDDDGDGDEDADASEYEEYLDAILDDVATMDLSGLMLLSDASLEEVTDAARDSSRTALATLGVDDVDDLQFVNQDAATWAATGVADLVSGITDSTRDMLRETISQGIADGMTSNDIADLVQDSYAFSQARSDLIANTEIARANSQGALISYKRAADTGVDAKKEWDTSGSAEVCDDCQANEDEGPIDLDDDFPSGDDAPPGHPNCNCALVPWVPDTDNQAPEEEAPDVGDEGSEGDEDAGG